MDPKDAPGIPQSTPESIFEASGACGIRTHGTGVSLARSAGPPDFESGAISRSANALHDG
jgi:hypothetical protein